MRTGSTVPRRASRSSVGAIVFHALLAWGLYWAAMAGLSWMTSPDASLVLGALVTPFIFGVVAHHYFCTPGARGPLVVAIAFVALVALLDAGVAGGLVHSLELLRSVTTFWVPLGLVFLTTWTTGEMACAASPAPAGDAASR